MNKEDYVIKRSDLERAHEHHDEAWLNKVYEMAKFALGNGGQVMIEQQFSDASSEIITVIDDERQLQIFMKKFADQPLHA